MRFVEPCSNMNAPRSRPPKGRTDPLPPRRYRDHGSERARALQCCYGITNAAICDCYRDYFYEMGRVVVPSTTTVSKSVCMVEVVIGLLGNFSEGSYHGCFSTTPSWTARASNFPI